MKIMYTSGSKSRFWYPTFHRFPSGAKELAWWRIRITWGCQFEKAMKKAARL